MNKKQKYILWFNDISSKDVSLVGGKNASLGEMKKNLSLGGINIPDGFALTSRAYWHFINENGLRIKIKEILKDLNIADIKNLQNRGKKLRNLIIGAKSPVDLEREVKKAYQKLCRQYGKNADVAVRSSATAEDMPTHSFAGQHETYLNVSGEQALLKAIQKCIASLFTDRAISYRQKGGFDHLKVALSVGVQKMVKSDSGSAGVIFTLDTETGFRGVVLITGSYGVGEMLVKGRIIPDEFYVFKPTLKTGFKPLIVKNLGTKKRKLIYSKKGGLIEAGVNLKDRENFCISEAEVLQLAKWAVSIEDHYGLPVDIEWAKDGKSGQIFIVQARPETVHVRKEKTVFKEYSLQEKNPKILLEGIAIGQKISAGQVNVIPSISKINKFKDKEILVTKLTNPDWEPIMKMSSGIITEEGGRTCFDGDTKILTDKGYLPIRGVAEIFKRGEIRVLSLNRATLRLEWKKVVGGFKRKSRMINLDISQTGRMKNNNLMVTADHKFFTFYNRNLVSQEIGELLKKKEYILSCQQIPPLQNQKGGELTPELSYFLGGISTDGHIYLTKTHGEVQFIQKRTPEKIEFIERMSKCLKKLFNYSFHITIAETSKGAIRGRPIRGTANRYRCYSKPFAIYLKERQSRLSRELLIASEENIYNFLAGTIDGDGTYNLKENRINIFCSKEELFQAISLACLRLGITFQVSKNRSVWNIQIVDKIEEILEYTSRVKGRYKRMKFGTRFFAAKQILKDIIDKVNYKGRIRPYVENNLLIDIEKIRNYIIPLIKGQPQNHVLTQIINSPLKALRVSSENSLKFSDVYNIEVEDNHNYLVFSSRYTPIVVENCHAAIVSRELGVPCIVGAKAAASILKTGNIVTIDCSRGETGKIYQGKVGWQEKDYDLKAIPKIKTKIMVNLGTPATAFSTAFLPHQGVGLAREEFIIASKIKVHPMELIRKGKGQYFVDELARGIGQIASAFWPHPVIVRFSDFKTNEYAALAGGKQFEPKEANPMLGWRGASRYYDPEFKPAFLLECQAIKKARKEFGLKNIWAMVPFCRTVEEGKKVLNIIEKAGLNKGDDGLRVIMMCEIPSNVILAEKFLEIFDGYSIGSNDLTQLALGIDRDNAKIAYIGDERNEAVKHMISRVIRVCRQMKKYCGICGQAPSDFPEFAEFLVKEGIESISLNPDTVIKTILHLSKKL